jgi:hypothetical protein
MVNPPVSQSRLGACLDLEADCLYLEADLYLEVDFYI